LSINMCNGVTGVTHLTQDGRLKSQNVTHCNGM
jgi:hypothetical protein